MERTQLFAELRHAFAGDTEPRSVAAFERRARAETLVLCGIAAIALLSVLVSLRSMGALPEGAVGNLEAAEYELASPVSRIEVPLESLAIETRTIGVESEFAAEEPAPLARQVDTAPLEARSEASFHAEFLAVQGAENLAALGRTVLASQGPAAQKLALLRAAYDRSLSEAPELFVRAAAECDAPSNGSESVARSAVTWLSARAQRQPLARDLLTAIAERREVAQELRAASVRALIAALPDSEAPQVAARFARDPDDLVHESARAALEARGQTQALEELR